MNEQVELSYKWTTINGQPVYAPSEIVDHLSERRKRPSLVIQQGRPVAIGISLSRPTGSELQAQGYFLLAEIGKPSQMPPENFPQTAEEIAAVVLRVTALVGRRDVYVALSCPTVVAFMIASLIGSTRHFRILHYENGKYTALPDYKPSRFKESLKKPS
ncbi:MAG: hypothetical protein HXY34_10820 [Candidatus Thorarchaeota archaeon]|nr:hypothetical protein [Candidatus Thorarchaeota archaeon]